ncbi:MAG: mechanosensitive ion channel family protein [Telluria sp.]
MPDFRHYFTNISISPANALFAFGAAIVSFIVFHTAVALFRRRLGRLEEKQADRPAAELFKATLGRTSNITVIALSLLIGVSALDLPPPWDERLHHLWFIALGIQLALYLDHAMTVLARRYFHHHASAPDSPLTVAHTLTVWAIKTALWVMFLLALLSNLGINVTTFVASLGIGGVAVALAVQNILGDLFASLSIAVDKPFEVGDSVTVAGISGTIEHVGLKTTRIRALSGEQVVISNAELLKNILQNFKRMQERRVPVTIKLNPDTPHRLANQVPPLLRRIVEAQQGVRFGRAHFATLDQNFLGFELVYYVLSPDYDRFMDAQQAIMFEAMRAFEQLGVAVATAAQHIVVDRLPEQEESERAAPAARIGVQRHH